ncbi:hypothetical protein BUALT_Bualt04G0006400 [Buddleja alternifolia]|uniref:ATPase AAA-type core domain-containing protein n=1 Tax=Buddleja alternifolia TaxID=168488 RepID=A0AAV6XLK2_9LAMI|nr:hypothetical protein BUALT_Bualt04G0006400 [Buddleja alternifolia]
MTAIKDNNELNKLLRHTSSKSIIAIEDIDCSIHLSGQREKKKVEDDDEQQHVDENDPLKDKRMKLTMSGLLNSIDGIWSACGGEKIIVFTTNHVEKLDPALIRRGRMDKHIEMSYCGFEAFKVFAKNYLRLHSHGLFGKIGGLLDETKMIPSDVADYLMPKSDRDSIVLD